VLNQLRTRGLFPAVNAPVLNQHGGASPPGFAMTMTGSGAIYYTLNGGDPRLWGGTVRPGLIPYGAPVILNATTTVKSRALSGQDSLLSIVQMPAGIPVGTLAIGESGATNAALLAAAVLALSDPEIDEALTTYRNEQTAKVADYPKDE
jgi:hypothetical protein